MQIALGIFAGGLGTRMGSVPKGLLVVEGETLLARWLRIGAACNLPCLVVGGGNAHAYTGPVVADVGAELGPLGGLLGLLRHARGEYTHVIAVACDMPFVSESLLQRLVAAAPAEVVAPYTEARWQPFFARYEVATLLPKAEALAVSTRHALQGLFGGHAEALSLDAEELRQLRDWDTPEDLAAER